MSGGGLVLQAARGGQPIRECDAVGGPVSIGRWEGATLRLDGDEILPVHVVLDPENDGRWRLIALGTDGCLVNGKQVRRAWVSRGDRIGVGTYEISVAEAATRIAASANREDPSPNLAQGERSLRATLRWRETAIDTRILTPGQVLTIGHGRSVTFELPGDEHRRWGAAACLEGVWHIALDMPMHVIDVTSVEHPLLSSAARSDGPALPRGFLTGNAWVPMPEGARLRLEAGDLAVDLERSPAFVLEHIARPPQWATEGGQRTIIALMFCLFLVAMLWITPRDLLAPEEANISLQDLVAKFTPPPVESVTTPRHHLRSKDELTDSGQEKHSGEAGQSGRRDAPDRNTSSAHTSQQVVANDPLLRMLSSGTTEQMLHGGALGQIDALGHLDGAGAGDALGVGGMALRGAGTGGGGLRDDAVGVGPIGSRGVGLGTAEKVGKIKGGPHDSDLSLDQPANVAGGLDREVIRRVILSHRAQIRYCYEKELSVHPELAGKVSVQFVIAADGSVTTARPAVQTLSDPEVGRCIVSKVLTWTFPKPKGGGVVVVTYPFLFKPAGQGAH